jgi:hypothetical protein
MCWSVTPDVQDFSPFWVARDVEAGGESFDAVEPPWLAVVDGVGSYQEGD